MQYPNPYNYPCFVSKKITSNDVLVISERKDFNDLQEAYLWALGETEQPFDPDVEVGQNGEWFYISFSKLRSSLSDDFVTGYLVFQKKVNNTITEYVVYYDIPEDDLEVFQSETRSYEDSQ